MTELIDTVAAGRGPTPKDTFIFVPPILNLYMGSLKPETLASVE